VTESNVPTNGAAAEPSSSLLMRVRLSDQAAWERLVNVYSPLVYRWCKESGLQPADAADIGQQVFLAVARKVRDFRRDGDGGSFRGWLRAITRNRLCDYYRATMTREERPGGDALDQAADAPGDLDPASDQEEEALVYRRAVELMQVEFEERTWRAFWQMVVDGRRAGEVARDLDMSPNAVYLARSRVLRRLREEFADLMDL
jgi:RNA polymerase sigma-70 factor, ECF subfamily